MKSNEDLADRLKEILLDGSWVTGTNIKSQIVDLDWQLAIRKVYNLNSIADLIFHIDYYIAGVLNAIETGKLEIKDKHSFDSPLIKSNKDWNELVKQFCNDSDKLVETVEHMKDDKLHQVFTHKKYGNYKRNINVIIEHSYYHLGQIMLIKKLLN